MTQRLWKIVCLLFKCWIYNFAITLLGIYPRETKIKTCTQMFIDILPVIIINQNQSRCPEMGEWLNKLVFPNNVILLNIIRNICRYTHQLGWFSRALCWVKKPIAKGFLLFDSIYIILPKWQKYKNGEKISVWVGLRREKR